MTKLIILVKICYKLLYVIQGVLVKYVTSWPQLISEFLVTHACLQCCFWLASHVFTPQVFLFNVTAVAFAFPKRILYYRSGICIAAADLVLATAAGFALPLWDFQCGYGWPFSATLIISSTYAKIWQIWNFFVQEVNIHVCVRVCMCVCVCLPLGDKNTWIWSLNNQLKRS